MNDGGPFSLAICVCVCGWWVSGWVGGGWGIAAIRAFTTHLNEWIFRAFRICILMEPVARCSCFSKQKHWQFYWVYFAPVFTLGQSTRNCCWHFLPCCHWWISAVSQTGGRRTEPIFFFFFWAMYSAPISSLFLSLLAIQCINRVTGRDAVSLFYGHTHGCAYRKNVISTDAVEICIFFFSILPFGTQFAIEINVIPALWVKLNGKFSL